MQFTKIAPPVVAKLVHRNLRLCPSVVYITFVAGLTVTIMSCDNDRIGYPVSSST